MATYKRYPKGLRGRYPNLRYTMRQEGFSEYEIRKAIKSLYELQQEYFEIRDNPPLTPEISFPNAYYEPRDRYGHSRFVQGEPVESLTPMAQGEIESNHYDDFYDWWADTFGEETWEDRHDIYPQAE